MTFYVENETETAFSFEVQNMVERVGKKALEYEACPYECEINVLITDDSRIKKYNFEGRGIDKATDVLSFPNIEYTIPADFSEIEKMPYMYCNPESDELILGDIILSANRVFEQAEAYGHGYDREFAFLIAHSMLHLLGYDHMNETEEKEMFTKQEEILKELGIVREL